MVEKVSKHIVQTPNKDISSRRQEVIEQICKEFKLGDGEGYVSLAEFLRIVEERLR